MKTNFTVNYYKIYKSWIQAVDIALHNIGKQLSILLFHQLIYIWLTSFFKVRNFQEFWIEV